MKRHRSQGFTLIELLVVVAIIAILASMLLPALSRARGVAQSLVCVNNQKQINVAFSMFADDNDGHFPPHARWYNDGVSNLSNQSFDAYTASYGLSPRSTTRSLRNPVWNCPVSPVYRGQDTTQSSYHMSLAVMGPWHTKVTYSDGGEGYRDLVRVDSVIKPSSTIALSEMNAGSFLRSYEGIPIYSVDYFYNGTSRLYGSLGYWHNASWYEVSGKGYRSFFSGTNNSAFVDGHVSSFRTGSMKVGWTKLADDPDK